MGECYNDDMPLLPESPPLATMLPARWTLDRRYFKQVYDNVHGAVYLDPLSQKFIDTEQFQRLRDLKQLGGVILVAKASIKPLLGTKSLSLLSTAPC